MVFIGDDQNDPNGCIFTQNLLVPDVTADEINAALASAGVSASAAAVATPSVAASSSAVAVVATPSATATASADTCSGSTAVASDSGASAKVASTSSLDLGSCSGSSPFIDFGPGFDGRKENSFEPADKATFNHGSALNIGVVANFICGQLSSACKASKSTVDKCNSAASAASKLSGQAAADSFNSALA